MSKFIYSLGLIALGLTAGQIIKFLVNRNVLKDFDLVSRRIKTVQNVTLLGIIPFINIATFWIIRMTDLRIMILPFLCVIQLVLGGVFGIIASKILKLDRKKTGSMFICGSLSNLTSFGGLICFVFLGETSYAFVTIYIMLEQLTQYTYGFPIAKLYGGEEQNKKGTGVISRILGDRYIRIFFSCIIAGIILNLSGLERPSVFSQINAFLIPFSSFLLIVTVGFYMRLGAVKDYIKECLVIGSIKFFIIPLLMVTIAYLIGIGKIQNGMVLKVVLLMSSMPPAFTALVPPQLYGLDIDLANSTWLFNTAALVVVLPVLYAIQVFLF